MDVTSQIVTNLLPTDPEPDSEGSDLVATGKARVTLTLSYGEGYCQGCQIAPNNTQGLLFGTDLDTETGGDAQENMECACDTINPEQRGPTYDEVIDNMNQVIKEKVFFSSSSTGGVLFVEKIQDVNEGTSSNAPIGRTTDLFSSILSPTTAPTNVPSSALVQPSPPPSKIPPGGSCIDNEVCDSYACGHVWVSPFDVDSLCCSSGSTVNINMLDYCAGLPLGDYCIDDEVCGSGLCLDNECS